MIDYEKRGNILSTMQRAGVNWVGLREASVLLGVHRQTVHTYTEKGHLQYFKMGARRMILLEEIDRFEREGNYKPPPTT